MKFSCTIMVALLSSTCFAQSLQKDTLKKLDEVIINRISKQRDISRLDSIKGTFIFSGKKTEVINLINRDAAISEKYARQVFAKIPGIFVYDMDGTGNQINISTRGLDPHRGWEFNIRKDGIITNSDMYGYPASHYNIPLEAVEKIELVRGTGSLQYGAQFGGMLNYVTKQPDSLKAFAFESINTAGTYGLLSTFNSISGTKGKFKYYAWFNKKTNHGYRKNSDSRYDAQDVSLFYDFSPALHIKAEWTRSNYIAHIAGPLTDALFNADPKTSTRSRNFYSPEINVPSITVDWIAGSNTRVKFSTSAIIGSRSSVLFDKPTTTVDAIDPATLQYANRQVDIDNFNSYTSELRVLQGFKLFNQMHHLAAGIQYMNNDLRRRQLGKGTTGVDYDLSLVSPGFGRDMHFRTKNMALFAENSWSLFEGFTLNTGIRSEIGETNMTGIINNYPENAIPNTIKHQFPLFGVNAQYRLNSAMNVYGGWSQAYRPVIFKDIIPTSLLELADKNLDDAKGNNLDAGFRGAWKFLNWDVSYFRLAYNNRLGTLAQKNANGDEIIFKTNIGNSLTEGIEFFTQAEFQLTKLTSFSLYTSTAYMLGKYKDAVVRNGNVNVSVDGNRIESVPEWQSRNGATFKYRTTSLSLLHSYTAKSFADAFNTVAPTATGSAGIVPSYHIFDLNTRTNINTLLQLSLNIGNAFDKHYFTKRPQFYPGPGIWPSDGRTYSITLGIKI
ncbi:MAG: TonB-dependent receptor [Bacteroidota bacterium]